MNNITGVVLAGGKSQRMKTDKALLKFNNKTLLENQVDLLSSVFNTVVISANTNNYSFLDIPIIKDSIKSKGPIGGIFSVLKNIETDYIFVLSVDMPFVSKELIIEISSEINNFDIVVPVNRAKYEPTCAIYSKNCINDIENQILNGDNKLTNLINTCNTKFITISEYSTLFNQNLFANLNYQKDLGLLT